MAGTYMIRCDMEGVSGVVNYAQAEPGKPEYAFGQRMFMSDLLALVEGLRAGGADRVVIYDEHYYGRNLELDRLPADVTAICGKPPYRPDWAGGLDASFSGMALLGLHAMSGTKGGLLPHSYEADIARIALNGVAVGEIGMEAAIAGDYDVPTLLVTGDRAGVAEAERLIPGIAGVTVKVGESETGGYCDPPAKTADAIRCAAERTARNAPAVRPFKARPPVTLEVGLHDGSYLDCARRLYAPSFKDDRTMVLEGRAATEVWAIYWQRKLRCQAVADDSGGTAA